MRRIAVCCCFLLCLTGLKAQSYVPDEGVQFLHRFEKSVMTHHYDSVMQYMDEEYVKVQYRKMLRKEQEQFIDEFFSGYDDPVNMKGFTNTRLADIAGIEYLTGMAISETEYQVNFKVTRVSGYAHYCQWVLRKYKGTWGLFGAVG